MHEFLIFCHCQHFVDLDLVSFFTCVFQVEELRVRDAKSGLKIAQVLEGFISRKVVKQTVMTVVYGVTRYGGRLQIEKRLKEIDEFPKVQ